VIPHLEAELYVNTVTTAVNRAKAGELVEGHAELVYGLGRAKVLREEGHEWAGTLITRYRVALDNYCESYGVRIP
jgi:hypothetical protein